MIFQTAITLIITFSILVIAHELGHFIVAKRSGIRVEEFALGFGPRIISFGKKGDTEYSLHLFPLGGFVKLAGMQPDEVDIPDGYQAQSITKRALTIFAGPFASFILAVVVFVSLGVFWGFPGELSNRIEMVNPKTEAARINLRAGDRILEINGKKIIRGTEIVSMINSMPNKKIKLLIQRRDKKLVIYGTPQWAIYYDEALWSFDNNKNAVVKFDDPKKSAVKTDDKLISISGVKITSGEEMVKILSNLGDKQTEIKILRENETKSIKIKPSFDYFKFMGIDWHYIDAEKDSGIYCWISSDNRKIKAGDKLVSINGVMFKSVKELKDYLMSSEPVDGVAFNKGHVKQLSVPRFPGVAEIVLDRDGKKITLESKVNVSDFKMSTFKAQGQLGFLPSSELVKVGLGKSLSKGLVRTINIIIMVIASLTGPDVKEGLGGPIMIAKMTQQSVTLGVYSVVGMLGGLSLSLAIINLLPIPIMDGGQLLALAIEKVRRKRFTNQQMQVYMMVGLLLVVLLAGFVFYLDIFKLTKGLVPQ